MTKWNFCRNFFLLLDESRIPVGLLENPIGFSYFFYAKKMDLLISDGWDTLKKEVIIKYFFGSSLFTGINRF